jgi:hypothetical protein
VIIVDDKLTLEVLGGRLRVPAPVATTWGFHCRLVRALQDASRGGAVGGSAVAGALAAAIDPPESRLRVLDPRVVTAETASLASRHRLNLLAAELFASAAHYSSEIYLSAPNVGSRWREVSDAEGIPLKIV